MNTADNTRNNGLTTEQIAAAGTGRDQNRPGPGEQAHADAPARQPVQRPPGETDIVDADVVGEDDSFGGHGSFGGHDSFGGNDNAVLAGAGAASTAGEDSVTADREQHATLLEDDELQNIVARWKEIQAMFVDEPTRAVEDADALVAELMQRLAGMFARERANLEQRWAGSSRVSTEELRQGLRRYRSFFERLLAA
jgi:hypothetical protein